MRDVSWERVMDRANQDGEFRIAARLWSSTVRLDLGDRSVRLAIADGALRAAAPCDRDARCDVSVGGAADAWDALLAPVPPPLHQDLFGGVMAGRFLLAGDLELFYAYYPAVRRLLDLARQARR
jgi:hypothetical protein